MKIRTVEITKQNAHLKLQKTINGVVLMILLCVAIVFVSQLFPISIPVVNMMLNCVGILGLMVGLAALLVISFTKSEIKALNILSYRTKYILKEVKDAEIKS